MPLSLYLSISNPDFPFSLSLSTNVFLTKPPLSIFFPSYLSVSSSLIPCLSSFLSLLLSFTMMYTLSRSLSLSLSLSVCEAKVLSGHFVSQILLCVCLHPYMCVSMHIHASIFVCGSCVYVCMCVCACVCVCVCVCVWVSEVSNIPVQANASAEICLSMQLLTQHYYS